MMFIILLPVIVGWIGFAVWRRNRLIQKHPAKRRYIMSGLCVAFLPWIVAPLLAAVLAMLTYSGTCSDWMSPDFPCTLVEAGTRAAGFMLMVSGIPLFIGTLSTLIIFALGMRRLKEHRI